MDTGLPAHELLFLLQQTDKEIGFAIAANGFCGLVKRDGLFAPLDDGPGNPSSLEEFLGE